MKAPQMNSSFLPPSAFRLPTSRRSALKTFAASAAGFSASGWLPRLAAAANAAETDRACILLWMTGGSSQLDTFDPKPDHENGGEFAAIDTAVPGIKIAEHLPGIARRMDRVVPVRSMSTKEGDHGRATFLARTGYPPAGPVRYPSLGSLLSKELHRGESDLPGYVSVSPFRFANPAAFGPGFLGPGYAPLVVGDGPGFGPGESGDASALTVRNLAPPAGVGAERMESRLGLLSAMEAEFATGRPDGVLTGRRTAYEKAVRMMSTAAAGAFELDGEPDPLRDRYGRNPFGQGCLLARRLVERGVPFVEVCLNGADGSQAFAWDTHQDNFAAVKTLCGVLDPAWSTLLDDLSDRGLLDTTTVVWMGEFGRTPQINANAGRDHFPVAWSAALSGGGVRGGQVVGATTDDGMEVADRPVRVPDLIATIARAVGVDPATDNLSNVGRPITLADGEAEVLEGVVS